MADWFVVLARWQREGSARADLVAAGFNCYQPLFREKHVIRSRRVWVERYLLGRYLLVEHLADWISQFVRISRLPYVDSLLMCDEQPLLAREKEVERLKHSEVRGYVPVPKKSELARGQKIIIKIGALQNQTAIFEKEKDGQAYVRLDLLGRSTRTQLPIAGVMAA